MNIANDAGDVNGGDQHASAARERGGASTVVLIVLIAGSLLAAVALVVVALQWSSTATSTRQRTATYERETRRLHARQGRERAAIKSLDVKATNAIQAFGDLEGAMTELGPSQTNVAHAIGDGVTLYNQGDFAGARAKFSGDAATALTDADTKTAVADADLKTIQKALADLKAANRG